MPVKNRIYEPKNEIELQFQVIVDHFVINKVNILPKAKLRNNKKKRRENLKQKKTM